MSCWQWVALAYLAGMLSTLGLIAFFCGAKCERDEHEDAGV